MKPREDTFGYYERGAAGGGKPFVDRREAGAQLARTVMGHRGSNPLVLGIPRGGVPVAYELAQRLGGELDVIVARKLVAPGREDLALGAVAADGTAYINARLRTLTGISDDALARLIEGEQAEAKRREQRLRGDLPALNPAGRVAIVVDDGLATGVTMRAAVRSLKERGAQRVVIAVPVASVEACQILAHEADVLICPYRPEPFGTVGQHYGVFDQTTDEEVETLLRAQREPAAAPSTSQLCPT